MPKAIPVLNFTISIDIYAPSDKIDFPKTRDPLIA
jgi:hypothetical protein